MEESTKDKNIIDINNLPEGWSIEEVNRGKGKQRIYIIDSNSSVKGASCVGCGGVYPIDGFTKASYRIFGIDTYCKGCKRNRSNQYYKDNVADKKVKQRAYRDSNRSRINQQAQARRTANKHSPTIYKITVGDYYYIGQTISISQRKSQHKTGARKQKHCRYFNNLYKSNPEALENAVNNMVIIKEFSADATAEEITEQEYMLQLEALQQGKKLLGKQYNDMAFKMWLVAKLGHQEAQRIIEFSRAINEPEETAI